MIRGPPSRYPGEAKTNGWRAPKQWALEKVTGPFENGNFLVSMLDFFGVVSQK